jgi:hypothetical protein
MFKREYRRFASEQALEILKVVEQADLSVNKLRRKHGLSPSVFIAGATMPSGHSAV